MKCFESLIGIDSATVAAVGVVDSVTFCDIKERGQAEFMAHPPCTYTLGMMVYKWRPESR